MLGVTIDCHLNWSEHISNTCSKLQKCCYSLRFLKNHCSKHVLLRIYHANFHSLLRFNILNWGTCASSSRILILQKRAIRIICGIRPRDSCKPFLKELKVLTVTDTALYQRGLFYNGCKLFNALPVHIKLASTLPTFKNKLKDSYKK